MTLILATIRLLAVDQTGVTQMFGDIKRAHTLRQRALGEVLPAGEPKPLCEQRTLTFEETTSMYEVCGERRVPWRIAPATGELPITRIDYDAIFAQAVQCPSTPANPTDVLGTTPTASKDCVLPNTINGGIITLENIKGETILVSARSANPSIIATPGRLRFAGTLTVESDLIIVAGGDVEIGAIAASTAQTQKVTIISALGGIRVGSIASEVSAIAAGRSTIEVPETSQSPPFPLPPLRGHEVIGIRVVGE
jgi:hypothetical protein